MKGSDNHGPIKCLSHGETSMTEISAGSWSFGTGYAHWHRGEHVTCILRINPISAGRNLSLDK